MNQETIDQEMSNQETVKSKQNPLVKLLMGHYRLVDVFWSGYFIVGFIIALVVSKLEGIQSIMVGDSFNSLYLIVISVAVWNSASRFEGKQYWSIMAKIMSMLVIVSSLMTLTAWVLHLAEA